MLLGIASVAAIGFWGGTLGLAYVAIGVVILFLEWTMWVRVQLQFDRVAVEDKVRALLPEVPERERGVLAGAVMDHHAAVTWNHHVFQLAIWPLMLPISAGRLLWLLRGPEQQRPTWARQTVETLFCQPELYRGLQLRQQDLLGLTQELWT